MQGVLYEEASVFLFALVTVAMGGWAAFMTGKASAETWRGPVETAIYLVGVAAGVRFIHFALFHGTLMSLRFFLVDATVIMLIGLAAWRMTRARQMTTQYWWLYERAGLFAWRERRAPAEKPP